MAGVDGSGGSVEAGQSSRVDSRRRSLAVGISESQRAPPLKAPVGFAEGKEKGRNVVGQCHLPYRASWARDLCSCPRTRRIGARSAFSHQIFFAFILRI